MASFKVLFCIILGVTERTIYCPPHVNFTGPISGQNAASENITEVQRPSFIDFNR